MKTTQSDAPLPKRMGHSWNEHMKCVRCKSHYEKHRSKPHPCHGGNESDLLCRMGHPRTKQHGRIYVRPSTGKQMWVCVTCRKALDARRNKPRKTSAKPSGGYPGDCIGRAIAAIEFVLDAAGPITQYDLEQHLGVHHRTAQRVLGALEERGYVRAIEARSKQQVTQFEVCSG